MTNEDLSNNGNLEELRKAQRGAALMLLLLKLAESNLIDGRQEEELEIITLLTPLITSMNVISSDMFNFSDSKTLEKIAKMYGDKSLAIIKKIIDSEENGQLSLEDMLALISNQK